MKSLELINENCDRWQRGGAVTKPERIEAYVNAEIERFKGAGGDIVTEAEAIAKIAFYMAVLRAGFEDDRPGFLKRVELASAVSQEVLKYMPANATLTRTEPS